VTCTLRGQRRLTPDEVARYLFRKVVSWGRSSNVFMENGSRLYLDVGSHPEYATPECDSIRAAVVYDRAGEMILRDLVASAEARLREEGIRGTIHLFKNNCDSAGNSYGCHENYLIRRTDPGIALDEVLIPFLVTRQIFCGAGRIVTGPRGPVFSISQRADHIWESVSSATTRSRPIINTRDEPHADADLYRRLHVIVGDSNMSDVATFVKLGSTACVLRMIEDDWADLGSLHLENPIRTIRDVSQDLTFRRPVRLLSGREWSALDFQRHFVECAEKYHADRGFPEEEHRAFLLWRDFVDALESDPDGLVGSVDWVTKRALVDAYCARHGIGMGDPRVQMLDLQYHDLDTDRGLYWRAAARWSAGSVVGAEEATEAMTSPPSTTRAKLRGEFIRRAKERKRDFTVDWVHLKINDQSQRTVLCKDPFRNEDERVDRLIAAL